MASALERLRKARQGSETSLASTNITSGTTGTLSSGSSALARLRAARIGTGSSVNPNVSNTAQTVNSGTSGSSALARLRAARTAQAQPTLTPEAQRYASDEEKKRQEEEKNRGGLLGGIGYVGEKITLGTVQGIEGIFDFLIGGAADLFGADDFAEQQFANDWLNYNHADEWFNPSEGWRFAGDVAGGIGSSIPGIATAAAITAVTGGAGAGLGAALVAGTSAAGTSVKEAYQETGKLTGKEWGYGIQSGVTEAAIEKISGGLGAGAGAIGKKIGQAFGKTAAKEVGKTTVKTVAVDLGKNFISEAFEEGFSEWVSPYYKRATYDPNAKDATLGEIGYAALVGGLSGVVTSGAGTSVTQVLNIRRGAKAESSGSVDRIKAISEVVLEANEGKTDEQSINAVRELYHDITEGKLKITEGVKLNVKQKRALGELQQANMAALFQPKMAEAAANAIGNADAVVERLNTYGNIKMADGKFTVISDIEQYKADNPDVEVRDITADDLRAGYDEKNGKQALTKAMQKNEVLRYVAASDVAGRLIMSVEQFEKTALEGTTIKDQVALNKFIEETLNTPEKRRALGAELGIAEGEWDALQLERLNEAVRSYRESGKAEAYKSRVEAVNKAKSVDESAAKKKIPSTIRLGDGKVERYKTDKVDIAVYRNGDSFVVYDYNENAPSRALSRAEVNSVLEQMKSADSAADVAKVLNSAENAELTNINQENMQVSGESEALSPEARMAKDNPSVAGGDTLQSLSPADAVQLPLHKGAKKREAKVEKTSAERVAEVKERIEAKKIDEYCRENVEDYDGLKEADKSMVRKVVREGRVHGLSEADILSYARVAAHTGLNIEYDANMKNGDAGYYDPKANKIVVNPKAEKKQELILIHELDHTIRAYLGDDGKIHYITYKDADKKVSKEKWEQIKKDYADQDIEVTREELFADEASAYYTEELIGTDKFIDLLLGKEPSLAKKILNFFTGAARAYSKDAKLSKEARRHYKNFKKMFDAFAEWNQGRNAETAVESVGDGKATRKTYASIKAKLADRMQLSNARQMLKNGASSEEVRKATGWFRGYDKKWRFEINDADSHLIENPVLEKHTDDGEVYFTGKLSDIFDHKELYAAYPELKDINVVIQKTELGVDGIYQPKSNYITLSIEQFKRHTKAYHDYLDGGHKAEIKSIEASEAYKEYNRLYDDEVMDSMEPEKWLEAEKTAREKFYSSELGKRYYELMWGKNGFTGDKFEFGWAKPAKETLLHELQHAVQNIEGFASGTNTRDADYDRNAGEIEARDTARRANMTAEERKNTQPDVYQEGVVVKRNKADAYLIVELQNGMQYVQASEGQVISGTDPEDWSKQVANYINKTIRNGTDFVIKTEQGDLLTITRDTAYKSATRNQVKNPDGTYRTMTDAEYRTKINASVHINELAQVSKKWNKPNVPDTKKHKFAKDGFSYRTAYFKDFDGKYYRLTISVGENGSVSTVYNVGQLKKDALPNGKIKTVYSGSKANSASHSSIISDSAEKSTGSAKKVSENSDKISKSARKSGDFEAKLSDAEDSDKVTISKGQAQKLAANYNSDRVYDKKDVVTAFRGIDGFANLPEDMQKELLRDVWVGLNSRYGKSARETFVEVMSNKIPYMLLTESYTEENAKEYGRLQSAKKRAKKTLEGEALKEKLEAIDRELEKLENVPDRLFDTYEQSRIDEINREIAEALNKLLDGGKPSLRSKIEGEFDASDAGKWKKKYIEAEFNETSAEKWKTKYYEARGRAKKLLNLSYQVQKMRDLKLGTFLNATDYKNEVFKQTFEILGSIEFRGNISPVKVRTAMKRLAEWYTEKNPVLAEIPGEPGSKLYTDWIALQINAIAEGNGDLTNFELDQLDIILQHATKIVENFNRVWKGGKWVNAESTAKSYIGVAEEASLIRVKSGSYRKVRKMLDNLSRRYFLSFGDPMSVFRYMDGYMPGFYTEMGEELRQGAFRYQVDMMEMKTEYDKFLKGNKKYLKDASTEVVEYAGVKMTKLQFMSLYMTMQRGQAVRGLAENGFSLIDVSGRRVEGDGFLERVQTKLGAEAGIEKDPDGNWKVSAEQLDAATKAEIAEMKNKLSKTDLEFIGVIESTLNGRCKDLKKMRDTERLGFSNTIEGYYYPIVRAMIAKNIDTKGMWGEIDRASNISANKDTVKGAKGALWIESADTVFNRHIDAVARYAELSPVIDSINKIFNLDVSGNKNKPKSVRTATFNAWQTDKIFGGAVADGQKHEGEAYLKELLADVQGIGKDIGAGQRFAEGIRGRFAIAALSANPKVLATQFSSVFAATSIITMKDITAGSKLAFAKNADADVDKYCPIAKLRNYDSSAAKAQGVIDNVSEIGEKLMAGVGFMDRQVVKTVWGGAQANIERTMGLKIGTEENKIEAGKLLEKIIFETQQNSVATEKSSAMRSKSAFMKTLTMFTSDAMKNIGRVIDGLGRVAALKQRIKTAKVGADGDTVSKLQTELKEAMPQARAAIGALAMNAVYMTLIARLFSHLYAKEDEEERWRPLALISETFGNMLGGLPVFSDVYDFFTNGYEISDSVYDTINDVLVGTKKVASVAADVVDGKATSADVNSAFMSFAQNLGTVLGLPVRNVRNLGMGLIRRFNPNAAYKMEMLTKNKNLAADFEAAIEAGDDSKASMILGMLLSERLGEDNPSVAGGDTSLYTREAMRMSKAGYNVLPRTIGDIVTIAGEEVIMYPEEQAALRARYSEAVGVIESLVGSSAYASLSDELRESAVRFVYDVYYDQGIYELYGYERNMKRRVFSKVISADKLALANAVTAGLESDYEDSKGKTVSLEKWATIKGTTARVNYSTVAGSKRKKVIAAINKLPLTTAEKLLIIAYKGYTIKDGDIRGVSAARAKQMLSSYARRQGLTADEAKALEGYL